MSDSAVATWYTLLPRGCFPSWWNSPLVTDICPIVNILILLPSIHSANSHTFLRYSSSPRLSSYAKAVLHILSEQALCTRSTVAWQGYSLGNQETFFLPLSTLRWVTPDFPAVEKALIPRTIHTLLFAYCTDVSTSFVAEDLERSVNRKMHTRSWRWLLLRDWRGSVWFEADKDVPGVSVTRRIWGRLCWIVKRA
jgi:hypothetical protein